MLFRSEYLKIPHKKLLHRNFALIPFLEINPRWKYPKKNINLHQHAKMLQGKIKHAPFKIRGTKMVGIINVPLLSHHKSQDKELFSFEEKIVHSVKDGSEIIDIGAESTRPKAFIKTHEEYWKIIQPYIKNLNYILKRHNFPISLSISIDTYHFQVIKKILESNCDIHFVNDVYGVESREMCLLLRGREIKYVFMHQLGKAGKYYLNSHENTINSISEYALNTMNSLLKYGISKNKLVFDPGIGFGKSGFQVKEILSKIDILYRNINIPIMVSLSRKKSILPEDWKPHQLQQEDIISTLHTLKLIEKKIDYVRVHNTNMHKLAYLV